MTEHPGMEMEPEERSLEAPNKDAKTWAMVSHLAAFAFVTCIPFANLIGPLIVWLIKRQDHPFVDDQGKESVNFQLTITIVGIALMVLFFIPVIGQLLSLIVGPVLTIAVIVLVIMGAVAANRGELYRYPVNLRLLK